MIKFIGLLTRKEGMSVEDFQRYWREVHGPIMARTPGMRRYVQSHAVPESYAGPNPPPFDGLAEAWFDSRAAFEAAQRSPQWQAGTPDARNFLASSRNLLTTEVPIIDAYATPLERQSMVKYVSFLTRKEGMSVEAFQRHWRDVHAPLIVAELTALRRYVQCHPLPETYAGASPPPFDGIPEAWYESMEAARPARRPEGQPRPPRAMLADAANFMKAGSLPSMIVREVIMIE